MLLARRRSHGTAWLLAILLLGAVWTPPLVAARRAGAGCATAAHACCCGHPGPSCCCDGHRGAANQVAALSRCGGGSDLPAGLVALPPALLAPVSGSPILHPASPV